MSDESTFFDERADQFWSETGPFSMLHRLNPTRLQFILSTHPLSQARVLDIGCGGGILAEAMAREGAHVTGIDLSSEVIRVAKAHAEESQLEIAYHAVEVSDWVAQRPAPYKIISCMEVLEHVDDPESLIRSARQLLAPDGVLVLSTIHRTPMAWLKMIGAAEHLLRWVPVGTHQYQKFIRPSELDRLCRRAGLRALTRRGLAYHPVRGAFHLTRSLGSHYLAAYRPIQTGG